MSSDEVHPYVLGETRWTVAGWYRAEDARGDHRLTDLWPEELPAAVQCATRDGYTGETWYRLLVPELLTEVPPLTRLAGHLSSEHRVSVALTFFARVLRAGFDPRDVAEAVSLAPNVVAQVVVLAAFIPGEIAAMSHELRRWREYGAPSVGDLYRAPTVRRGPVTV